jgi:hypothetical protein
MSVLTRAGALFLAPQAAPVPREATAQVPAIATAAVLAAPADLDAVAGAVAARLRTIAKARTAVVCRPGWTAVRRPATPPATRLARRLAERQVEAAPAGVLCRAALPEDPGEAVRAVWRLIGAVDVPLVVALPGRLDGFDPLLAELDHLFLAAPVGGDGAISDLALASLEALGPPVRRVQPAESVLARRHAALGLAAVPALEVVAA